MGTAAAIAFEQTPPRLVSRWAYLVEILRGERDGHVEVVPLPEDERRPEARRRISRQIAQLARHHGITIQYRRSEEGLLIKKVGMR